MRGLTLAMADIYDTSRDLPDGVERHDSLVLNEASTHIERLIMQGGQMRKSKVSFMTSW